MRLYLNFKGPEGIETLNEYDPKDPIYVQRVLDLRANGKRSSTRNEVRKQADADAKEANRVTPGHYVSTKPSKAWANS
jgi:hypothetical protein